MYVTNVVNIINAEEQKKFILASSLVKYKYPYKDIEYYFNGEKAVSKETLEHMGDLLKLLISRDLDEKAYSMSARTELDSVFSKIVVNENVHEINMCRLKWLFLELAWYEYHVHINKYHRVEDIDGFSKLLKKYEMIKELVTSEENRRKNLEITKASKKHEPKEESLFD